MTHPQTTQLDLDAIRARVNAATPAPWLIGPKPGAGPTTVLDTEGYVIAITGPHVGPETIANAAFIANARTDIEALLAEVERLRQARVLADAADPDVQAAARAKLAEQGGGSR